MEEFADKIVYLIVTVVIFIISAVNSSKRKKQKLEEQRARQFAEQKMESETLVNRHVDIVDEQIENELFEKEEPLYDKPEFTEKKDDLEPLIDESDNFVDENTEFDLKEAVIYSEIINRKYTEI